MSKLNEPQLPTKFARLVEIIKQSGQGLRPTDYKNAAVAAGMKAPSGAAVVKATAAAFGTPKDSRPSKRSSKGKKRKYTRRAKVTPVVTDTLQDRNAVAPEISDKTKYDLIQVKETAALVGGLDRVIALASWLQNWQL